MRLFGPIIFSVAILTILTLVNLLLFKYIDKTWWRNDRVRRAVKITPFIGLGGIVLWITGYYTDLGSIATFGSVVAVLVVVLLTALIISIPFSAIFNRLSNRPKKTAESVAPKENIDNSRRRILKGTAAAFPLITLSAAGGGVAKSFLDTKIYSLPIGFKDLPKHLEGLRILHLSDSHLGIYKHLDDYENILRNTEKYNPDLVLITGDIADDLNLLPEALKMAASIKPKYGAYASLGNHEYYRGITQVMNAFDNGPVELLRSSGKTLEIDGGRLYLAGCDDPVGMRRVEYGFLTDSIEKALTGRSGDDFTILMSHRPESFDPASEMNINLTLSGHTHGGQAGVNGRSLWSVFSDRYLWGEYEKNGARMYLSSGIGHWFPFRLGCPTEAPIIELTSKITT